MLVRAIFNKIIKNGRRQDVVAALLFLFLVLLYTFPVVINLHTHLIGFAGDSVEYLSYFYSFKDNLLKGNPPFWFSDMYRYPLGVNNALSDARIFTTTGGILSFFIDSIVLYNVLVFVALLLNTIFSYLFYKNLTKSFLLGLAGGMLNGFSPWVMLNAHGSINAMLLFCLPIFGSFLLRVVRKGVNPGTFYGLAAYLYLVALCNVSLLMFCFLAIALSLLLAGILNPQYIKMYFVKSKEHVIHVIAAMVMFIGLFTFTFPFHIYQLVHGSLHVEKTLFIRSDVPLLAFINPPADYNYLTSYLFSKIGVNFPFIESWMHQGLYVGVITTCLFLFVSFGIKKSTTLRLFYTSALIYVLFVFFDLSFVNMAVPKMPQWIGYVLVYITDKHIYFMMLFWFFVTCAITYGFKVLKVRRKFVLAVIVILIIERLNIGYPALNTSLLRGGSYAEIVQNVPGDAVLDVPLDVFSLYNLLPFYYKKPIVGGMIHWFADSDYERSFLSQQEISRFSCNTHSWQDIWPHKIVPYDVYETEKLNRSLIEILKHHNIRTIVIHKDKLYREKCGAMREQLGTLLPDMKKEEIRIDPSVYSTIQLSGLEKHGNRPRRIFSNQDVFVYQL